VSEVQRDRVHLALAHAKSETLAAAAIFRAGKGERSAAKQWFISALRAANALAPQSADPRFASEIANERAELLSTVARYMHAADDKKAAERVFKLAMDSAAGN
jgi:hypothetical protein